MVFPRLSSPTDLSTEPLQRILVQRGCQKNQTLMMHLARIIALLSVVIPASCTSAQDSILAEINGKAITIEEFEENYIKSIGDRSAASRDSLEAYEDYLTRYVNFRAKLLEAHAAGYFEDEDLLAEINGYRTSFARPYLTNNEILEPMVRDLYEKRKEFIHASHIMTTFPRNNPSPADTLRAWEKILALQDSIRQGAPFDDLAARNSEDPSANESRSLRGYRGDLGWFTGGHMIDAFETVAYNTPIGEVSGIIRSSYGYHILKVHDRENTKPDYVASHIMVQFQNATPKDSAYAYAKMDSLKTLIDAGIDFAEIARNHSDDKTSAQDGGSLRGQIEFRNQNFDPTFLDALFSLETPGQMSDIIETPFGLHLIKLDSIAPVKTFEQSYDQLSQMVQSLPRIKIAEAALAKSLRTSYATSVDTLLLTRLIENAPADSVQKYLKAMTAVDSLKRIPLISIQDSVYSASEFVEFASSRPTPHLPTLSPTEQALKHVDPFLNDKAIFYRSFELESTDEEFQEIMQDFKNGLAIFKIMEDSVWNATSQDTLRLEQYYAANHEHYQWPDRYRLVEVSGVSDSLLAEAMSLLTLGSTWSDFVDEISEDSTWNLQVDTVLVAGKTDSVYDHAVDLPPGEHTEILSSRSRKLVLYMDGMEPARPKTFEEAVSEVIADVQVEVEETLHQRLRGKYRVSTFPEQLEWVFQEP